MAGGNGLAIIAALGGALLGGAAPATARERTISLSYPVVELRQYTLHDGMRDTLIDLFEREFVESQEALGMKVIGTFRDLDRPNRFVWLRGFRDMGTRLVGLTSFYGGPLWLAHREAANATIDDSDNVLLLRAAAPGGEFHPQPTRPALGARAPAGLIVATIEYLNADPAEAIPAFETKVKPALERAGIQPLAWFVTEEAPNNFPRLPVRSSEHVLVWFARFADDADRQRHKSAMGRADASLSNLRARPPEVLRLAPTSRSELR